MGGLIFYYEVFSMQELIQNQQEYFKNSNIRNENGDNVAVYLDNKRREETL